MNRTMAVHVRYGNFLCFLSKTRMWNGQTLRYMENVNDDGLFFKFLFLI